MVRGAILKKTKSMEVVTLVISGLKTIVKAIYPPLKKRFYDQPKIYIRLSGNGNSFRSEKVDLYQNPENALNRLEIVYAGCRKQLTFLNNSEHTAYKLKLLTQLDKNHFTVEPEIDNFKPLLTNSEITYSVKFSYTFERKEREAQSEYPEPEDITKLKLTLEYTNVKETKFYTTFDNLLDEEHKNTFVKKIRIAN